mmetsp:Transcript_18572/g.32936  ORF Transcript_18572/g.32936 Transcript_18572/m.32936 type:complete len:109 (-) Transcript_18572:182-508(-)
MKTDPRGKLIRLQGEPGCLKLSRNARNSLLATSMPRFEERICNVIDIAALESFVWVTGESLEIVRFRHFYNQLCLTLLEVWHSEKSRSLRKILSRIVMISKRSTAPLF